MRARWPLLSLALVVGLVPPVAQAADPLVVTTLQGSYKGVATATANEWRGIPYVAPPLGELRFRPPQPPASFAGIRDATAFAPVCLQLVSDTETIGSEDCIYLNVFTPPNAAAGSGLPVMVHLHGGGNVGFWAYQNADAFVSKGVIVVTVEYRMGPFGFMGHPALSAEAGGSSGEYGILDQIAALEWVRDNIAAFGGDPADVTLFGESAGSFDAAALVASPLTRGLFRRAALQTEAFWPLHGAEGISDAENLGVQMASVVGCADAADVAACLRSTPAEDLVFGQIPLGFFDVLPFTGGVVLPEPVLDLVASETSTVPLLIGSNAQEGAHFVPQVYTGELYRKSWYFRDTNALAGPQAGRVVQDLYPLNDYDSPMWASVGAFSDAIYTCPIRRLGRASSGPVWRYLYTHVVVNNDFLASLRAAHFLDELYLWHDPELLAGFGAADYAYTAQEELLSFQMSTYWTNFAKTGDPNGGGLPIWPQALGLQEQVLELDETPVVLDDWHVEQCEFWDTQPLLFPLPREVGRFGLPPR